MACFNKFKFWPSPRKRSVSWDNASVAKSFLSDIITKSKAIGDNCLGVFYWEPAWLPVSGAGWATAAGQSYNAYGNDKYASNYSDGKASWSNQGLFSYTGKALPSLATYKHIQNKTNDEEEVATKVSRSEIDVVLNLALNQSLPTVFQVETNFDALRNYAVIWNEKDLTQLKQVEKNIVHASQMKMLLTKLWKLFF